MMKIGDEVYVHGYVDEIRYDDTKRVSTVIIRNDGGYFGTVEKEIKINEPNKGKWIESVKAQSDGVCLEKYVIKT